jgi:hypothetical protein
MFRATPGIGHRTPRKRAEEINDPAKFGGPSAENHDAAGGHPLGAGMPPRQKYEGIPPQVDPGASPSKSTKSPFKGG